MAGHPDGLLGLLSQIYGLDDLGVFELLFVSVVLELGAVELELELELLVLVVPTLLPLLVPLLVPVWSVVVPVPPWFGPQPAKATAAQKMRIDFFISKFLEFRR
jgi:hypothetical protein